MNFLKIKKNNQKYLKKIKLLNPDIFSGRKNLTTNYERILKNILLTKIFKKTDNINKFLNKKIKFKDNKNYIIVYFD